MPEEENSVLEICRVLAARHDSRASAEDIFYCFRLLLGRDPNPEEVQGHMLAIGDDLSPVVRQYVASQEFAARNLIAMPEAGVALVERDGYKLYVDPNDAAIGRHVVGGQYEDHVVEVFRRHIRPGATVVDIGANVGFFTALSAHLVGKHGRVISIEPNPVNCRYIEATKLENGFTWQKTYCVAATVKNELLALHSAYSNGNVSAPGNNVAALMRSMMVQGIRLDAILMLERLDFVKIDVEGHEMAALQGFLSNLSRFRPVIVSEFMPSAMADPKAYLALLHDLGYNLSVIKHKGTLIDCGQDAEAVMEAHRASGVDHIDIVATQPPLPAS